MSIYSNVTEEKLNKLAELSKQQINQRTINNKIRILKETHDEQVAEALKPIPNLLPEVNVSTKNLEVSNKQIWKGNQLLFQFRNVLEVKHQH